MVTVAKSLDGPIKLLFPRTGTSGIWTAFSPNTEKIEMSLLGLGDIVIPGFFLSLLLRFDAHLAEVPYFPLSIHYSFPKPYFHSGLLGYVIGLATTLYVMIGKKIYVYNSFVQSIICLPLLTLYFCSPKVWEAAQPALLYLVPACLGSSLLCALVRGELKELFAYSEEEEEEKEEVEGDEQKDTKDKKDD